MPGKLTLKDTFTSGPAVTRQERLTLKGKSELHGIVDATGWTTTRQAAALRGDEYSHTEPTAAFDIVGATLPGSRSYTRFAVLKREDDGRRVHVKIAYDTAIGSPDASDVLAFVAFKFPNTVLVDSLDRKSGIIEAVLEKVSHKRKKSQMDAANIPAGTAQDPIDGQRDALSEPEIEGTGKVAQAGPPVSAPVSDEPPPAPDVPSMDGPGALPPEEDLQEPESEMSLGEAIDILQEATEVIVRSISEGDAVIDGKDVEPVDEAPLPGAPPAAAPFAAGAPVQAGLRGAQSGPKDPKAPFWLQKQKMLELKQLSKQRVQEQAHDVLGIPNKAPATSMQTSNPGTINKQKPNEQPDYKYGTPEDQEFFWLDELANTAVNTSWDDFGKRQYAPGATHPEPISGQMPNQLDRPYGYTEGGQRTFQGLPFVDASKDKGPGGRKRENTLMSVLPTQIYKKIRDLTPPLREHGPLQWQKLSPEERAQAMHDMAHVNQKIRDRIRNILNQTPEGLVKKRTKVQGPQPTAPRTMEKPNIGPGKGGVGLKPVPPTVRKKGVIDEIMAVDPKARAYWEDLLGQYGHMMTRGCCPEHDGALDRRETDMREIAAEIGRTVTDDEVRDVCASLSRPKCIGFLMEFAKSGFQAPPMDKMVDMAMELAQSDAGLARQLDRLTLKYLMKTSDLMNSMTPDAQRTLLIRAVRADKRIYNSLLRLHNQAVGVQGPVQPDAAPMAVAAALDLTAAGLEIKPHGQLSDAVKIDHNTDKANKKDSQHINPGHVRFMCEEPRIEGKYMFLDVTWDPSECKGRGEESIRQLLISYAKGLESFKEYIDLGFIGTPHLKDIDVEAGFGSIFFRSNKGGDGVPVTKRDE